MSREAYVYILASSRNGTLYVGVTSNLIARIYTHRNCEMAGFTNRYSVHRLVYFERHNAIYDAITREKAIKKWRRAWKLELIESYNPQWEDLYDHIV